MAMAMASHGKYTYILFSVWHHIHFHIFHVCLCVCVCSDVCVLWCVCALVRVCTLLCWSIHFIQCIRMYLGLCSASMLFSVCYIQHRDSKLLLCIYIFFFVHNLCSPHLSQLALRLLSTHLQNWIAFPFLCTMNIRFLNTLQQVAL